VRRKREENAEKLIAHLPASFRTNFSPMLVAPGAIKCINGASLFAPLSIARGPMPCRLKLAIREPCVLYKIRVVVA
jgi:hypothetical protein